MFCMRCYSTPPVVGTVNSPVVQLHHSDIYMYCKFGEPGFADLQVGTRRDKETVDLTTNRINNLLFEVQ
jgi:hypothetical protein